MKKEYISPELEVVRYTLVDVLSNSPTDTVPIIGGGGELPGDDDSLPDGL